MSDKPKPVQQPISPKLLVLLVVVCVSYFAIAPLLLDVQVNQQVATVGLAAVLFLLLAAGTSFIALYFKALQEKNKQFSDSTLVKAGLFLVLLVLALRFELAARLLDWLAKLF